MVTDRPFSPPTDGQHKTGLEPTPHPPAGHEQLVQQTEGRIEAILKHDSHDFAHVFEEIEKLRRADPKGFQQDLEAINKQLHDHGLLPQLDIIQDDRSDGHGEAVVSEDKQNPRGNRTMVSTSHHRPHESHRLHHAYSRMHHAYNKHGWEHSVDAGGGADGGIDKQAVGGHVPDGARKELIDKALELAGLPVNAATEAAVNKIVTRESSWNPNITNNWDSNAKAGHPSTGLMQTIPSTFQRWALPGLNTNIHDPLSNLVAGIRYADHTYGRGGSPGTGLLRVASRPGGY